MIFQKTILWMCALIFLCACSKEQSLAQSHDGRLGSACNGSGGFCLISFSQLVALPERYDNHAISVSGYLVLDDGVLALYPSVENYRSHDTPSSLVFQIPASQQNEISEKYAFSYVRIVGGFSFKEGFDGFRFGVFEKVTSVIPLSLRDAIGKREQPSVRVEDIDDKKK